MAAAALLCAACGPSAPPTHAPHIGFSETQYDFGRVQQGTTVTHQFTARNTGGLNLAILSIRTGCAGTTTLQTDSVIPAGSEGRIVTSFDTSHALGHAMHSVTVYSNDPAQPVSTLMLTGAVEAEVAAEPAQLYVGRLQRGQSAPLDVRLIAAGTAGVGPIQNDGAVLDAQLHSPPRGTEGKLVRVAIRPDAPLGRFSESIFVHTNSRQRPVLTIPVVGIVDGERYQASAPDQSDSNEKQKTGNRK